MPSRTAHGVLAALVIATLGLATPATAAAPIAKRFPAPGEKRKVVRTVRITFKVPILTGTMAVKHEGVLVTPFTTGIVAGGRALQATFPDGLPKGRVSVAWRVRPADRVRVKGKWSFRVTTGDPSHGHG
jgi:methionine-rich copper-binding protein CopC